MSKYNNPIKKQIVKRFNDAFSTPEKVLFTRLRHNNLEECVKDIICQSVLFSMKGIKGVRIVQKDVFCSFKEFYIDVIFDYPDSISCLQVRFSTIVKDIVVSNWKHHATVTKTDFKVKLVDLI